MMCQMTTTTKTSDMIVVGTYRARLQVIHQVWEAVTLEPTISILELSARLQRGTATIHAALMILRAYGVIVQHPRVNRGRQVVIPRVAARVQRREPDASHGVGGTDGAQ
jgi:hypothetical protein